MVLIGYALAEPDITSLRLQQWHFEVLKQLGYNTVLFPIWWGKAENMDGTYNETLLSAYSTVISRAQTAGLQTILSARICFHPTVFESWWTNWTNQPTTDYAILSTGIERYKKFWRMLVLRFPSCIFSVWHFPMHNEGYNAAKAATIHNLVIPEIISTIRSYSSNEVIATPVHQGLTNNGYDSSPYLSFQPYNASNITYGLGHMMPWPVLDGANWDKNYNLMDNAFIGVNNFVKAGNKVVSIEYAGLDWPTLDPSRLECLAASIQRMNENKIGWMYWRIDLVNRTNENIVADIPTFTLNQDIISILKTSMVQEATNVQIDSKLVLLGLGILLLGANKK